MFFPLLIITGYVLTYFHSQENSFVQLISQNEIQCRIQGEVYKTGSTDYGYKIFVRNTTATVNDVIYEAGDCIVYYDKYFNTGDTIEASGLAKNFDEVMNPGEFNTKQYYNSLKICYRMYPEEIILVKQNHNPIYSMADKVRNKLSDTLYKLTDEKSASVFAAMLLGEKDDLDSEISDLFSSCGIGHILAISGLHISLIGMGFYKILRKTGLGYISGMIIAGSMIIFYGIITGNGVSTIRAIIMFLVSVYANVIGRTYDLISATALAATVMLMDSPLLIYNSGFILSFTAIIGIGAVNPVLCKIIASDNKIIKALLSGFSIQLVTLPVIMYSYYEIPVYSVLINLIVIPLMTYVMIFALSAGVIGSFSPIIGRFCIGPGVYILKMYEWLCNLCLNLPGSLWICGRPDLWQIVMYYIVLGISLIFITYKEKLKYITGIVIAMIIIIIRLNNSFEVTFLHVGQGDGIFIRSGKYNILVDGGSSDNKSLYDYTLEPFLMSEGVEVIHYAFVTHPDSDHMSGIRDLLIKDKIKIETLVLPSVANEDFAYTKLSELAKKHGVNVVTMHKGMKMKVGDAWFTCLHPEYECIIAERNDYSTVLLIEYEDFQMLLTGDISSAQEDDIANKIFEPLNIDVLKAAHHGSGSSNSLKFLQKFNPDTVVISCGKDNEYGHPAKEALERMATVGANIRCIYEEGAIIYKRGDIRVFL